jgi:hypothetical protein
MRHPRTRFAATISRWLSLRRRRLRFSAATADEIYRCGKFEKAANAREAFASTKNYRVENGPQRDHRPADVALQAPQSAGPAAQMGNNTHLRSRVGRRKLPVSVNGTNDKS